MTHSANRLIDTGLRVPLGVYAYKVLHPALIRLDRFWLYGRQQRRYFVMPGDYVSGYTAKFGTFEAEEIAVARHLCREALGEEHLARSTMVDAGCHIGNYSVELGPLFGSVLAIDAVASYVHVARANLAWNGLQDKSAVVCAAISDREGPVALHVERQGNLGHARVANEREAAMQAEAVTVEAAPLDKLVHERGLVAVAFIKLDVEGQEGAAIQGALQTIRGHAPILQIEVDRGNLPAVRRALESTGIDYEAWQVARGNPLHEHLPARLWSALRHGGNPVFLRELGEQTVNMHHLPCVLFVPSRLRVRWESIFPVRGRAATHVRKDAVRAPAEDAGAAMPLAPARMASPAATRSDDLVVVVLARNEEQHLPRCLESARFAARIVVVDAGSTDRTVDIARAHGAQVELHDDWQGFGVQRARALAHCGGARYIFFLDADEVITPALQAEIAAIVASGEVGAWTVRWVQVAFGRTLTGVTSRPGMPRLFHADALLGFEGAVHEQAQLRPGTVIRPLKQPLLHYSYDSVQGSLDKLRQYALLGASKRAARNQRGGVLRGLASALSAFLRLYIVRRAFLHGGPGFLYCYVLAQECFFRYAALEYDRERLTDRVER